MTVPFDSLRKQTPILKWKIPALNYFLTKDLEKVFFQLSEIDMSGLGFDIDQRPAVKMADSRKKAFQSGQVSGIGW